MREHITSDIQAAAITDMEAQLSQLEALRKRKQQEIRQLRKALKLVEADANPASGPPSRVTPITAGQKKPGGEE